MTNAIAYITGYAALYDTKADIIFRDSAHDRPYQEIIRSPAFRAAVDRSRGGEAIPCTVHHDPARVLGWDRKDGGLVLLEKRKGLKFGLYLPDNDLGRQVLDAAERGTLGASFLMERASVESRWHRWCGQVDDREILRIGRLADICLCPGGRAAYHLTVPTMKVRWKRDGTSYAPSPSPSRSLGGRGDAVRAAALSGGVERRDFAAGGRLAPRVERRVGADCPKSILGYGAVFYDPSDPDTEFPLWDYDNDRCVERLMPGCFDGVLSRGDDVVGLFNHDPNIVLGRVSAGTMTLSKDGKGLKYSITPPDSPLAKGIVQSVQRGDVTGSSFSFTCDKDGQKFIRQGNLTVREIHSVSGLFDTGPVVFPAYGATTAGTRGSASGGGRLPRGLDGEATAILVRARCAELGL